MHDDQPLDSRLVEGIQERKGRSIKILNLSRIENAGVGSFIICQGTSSTHVASIADCVREYMHEKYGIKPFNYDGYKSSQWIVLDYGSSLVHVFTPEWRTLYNLEELWSDADITEIPDLD